MKKTFGAFLPLCGILLACSIENLDLNPDTKNQESSPNAEIKKQQSSLDAEAKTTYNLKIVSAEVSRYAGQTCFVEATSVDLSPDKIVAERLLTTQKTFAADLKTIELTLQAKKGSKVEVFIRGKAYPNVGSVTANDQREDAERGCAWGRVEFEAGSGKDVVVTSFRTFLPPEPPPMPTERGAPTSKEGPSASNPDFNAPGAAESPSVPPQQGPSASIPVYNAPGATESPSVPPQQGPSGTAPAPNAPVFTIVTPPPAPQVAPSSP